MNGATPWEEPRMWGPSIVGFGALFELYASNFLMGHFWAVLIILFALAFSISEFLGYLERKVAYYAAKR